MGLDQFLYRKFYVWGNNKGQIDITCQGKKIIGLDKKKVDMIRQEEIYWRKANQIHKWFVDNVQEGNDDCGNYEVSREKLIELRDTIRKVLKTPKLAKELLPPTSGFFFGGEELDEHYWYDLKETEEKLTKVINAKIDEHMDCYFEYHSSW